MALHNLKITVIDGGKATAGVFGGGSEGEVGEEKNGGNTLYKIFNYNQAVRNFAKQNTSATTFFAIQQGISLAKQTGREFVNYYVSDIGRANGDSNYQAIVNRKIEVATDTLGFVSGALSGAAMGSVAGPVGAAVGAIVGFVSQGVSLGFKYAERERAYEHEIFQENTSQAYQLARANYTALTGRVR